MTGGSGTISSATTVFDAASDGGACTTFYVECLTSGSGVAGVYIPGLHQSDELFLVVPGKSFPFRLYDNGISNVTITGVGGGADVLYGVLSRTHPR